MRTRQSMIGAARLLSLAIMWLLVAGRDARAEIGHCPTEPLVSTRSGMTGDGWDGPGQNAVVITWRMEGSTPDFTTERAAILRALQAWADVVQINFLEEGIADDIVSIDFDFLSGNHAAAEPQEAGDPDCPFDGPGGVLAHAGFPPGVNSLCISPMPETFAGNVHFDEAETWEEDDGSASAYSLTLVACHEIGHALGLTHSGGNEVMRPSISATDTFAGLTANDIANIRAGYLAGTGSVTSLDTAGIWVDWSYIGFERGIQSQPFNTTPEGVAGVPPASTGIVVHIRSGFYPQNISITKSLVLRAENGVVALGH